MADQVVPLDQLLPPKLALIALNGRPVFPGIFTPMVITNPVDVKIVEEVSVHDGFLGLVLQASEAETPSISDLYTVGTLGKIVRKINLPDGGVNVFVSTIKRFKIQKTLSPSQPMVAAVSYLEDEEDDTAEVKALTRAIISEMKQISENNPLFSEEMRLNMLNIDNPSKIADFVVSILNIDKKDMQKVLEITNVRKRLEQALVYIKKEQDLLRIQRKIATDLNEKIAKNQRDYFLKEELKEIRKELGETKDPKETEYEKLKEKFATFDFVEEVKETVDEEMEKFNMMEPHSAEFVVTRNYLELIADLPWNDPEPENFSLLEARKILDEDHYGLKDVKDRIIEYLAVRKLRAQSAPVGAQRAVPSDGKKTDKTTEKPAEDKKPKKESPTAFSQKDLWKKEAPSGSILCLVGPPGVGKTSIGRSVARALGKEFFRFSVGGMRDEAEIKGHRRTYIGAMPGKIIQGLKIVKTKDPVFMIDEIDKMGASYQGDPASALLEVLDPEQNFSFRDHYLDLPFDISKVFFIVTANTLDTIPAPLLDRMEIIQLPGYIDTEKLEIAKHYLVPKSLAKNGLKKGQVKYNRESLLFIANSYARESGVRSFEKNLDKIHRKVAKELIEAEETKDANASVGALVRKTNLRAVPSKKRPAKQALRASAPPRENILIDRPAIEKHLGKPIFREDEVKKADRPGMSVGLAWTSMGGDTLVIEAISISGKGKFTLTGQMGDVMKESAEIALTVAEKIAIDRYGLSFEWFEKNHIHLHIPEGATKKDGPSAGITMATALVSLLIGKTIKPRLAMTGELSLTGQVLPIGGLKEKTIAAVRNKTKHIIIPRQNLRDLDDIPDYVKKSIEFHPVERFEEVLKIVLPGK
ncbi:MAG: endopeptidase La [Spirochaetaceae bacterium]|jgi:ATP-dependent Lon protease|nr:endopeptidase La [Spirochaetaceae bacterium]